MSIWHPTSAQYTFFPAAHGNFPNIDHILGHNSSLSKYKKIEIIPCTLSDHNALKLEINNKNNSKKHANKKDTKKSMKQKIGSLEK
jgi:endonuclease/exonuclease/phosphatase family metal-dependent hydrolase